jgi:glycosyltransferase involved in cell wall biosynthesis
VKLRNARLGYSGYSADMSGPGDRRRLCAYAAERGIPYERADVGHDYDVVLITHNSDIPGWIARKRREGDRLKLVFELVDSYFERRQFLHRLLKGFGRYALGIDSRLSPDFLSTLISVCEAADAVICSTEEQRETIRSYNPNVFISFDYFGNDLGAPKTDYRRSDKLRVLWEGQSTTLPNIGVICGALNDLRDRLQLHVVTDPIDYRHFGRFGPHSAHDELRGIDTEIVFHPWERDSFSGHITAADLAVIPINMSDPMARAKSASKLIMLWQLGMPVLTSATTAYTRLNRDAGLDMLCANEDEWRRKLEQMIVAPFSELERVGQRGRAFVEQAYSKDEFLRRFDEVFRSVGFEV